MTGDVRSDGGRGERLSALIDGELAAGEVAASCGGWCEDAQLRVDWHCWHVIGDVLRSEDLAAGAADDARFLAVLRSRLAAEPVVLAPAPLVAVASGAAVETASFAAPRGDDSRTSVARDRVRARRWAWPSAVAAGVVLVAGTAVTMRSLESAETDRAGSARIAASSDAGPVAGPGSSTARAAAPTLASAQPSTEPALVAVGNGQMVRDARLERYLAAHRQFAGTTALPSAFLRHATVEVER